jgi:hypothetical protein
MIQHKLYNGPVSKIEFLLWLVICPQRIKLFDGSVLTK